MCVCMRVYCIYIAAVFTSQRSVAENVSKQGKKDEI